MSTRHGFNSQVAATLDTASGPVFVKGLRQDHPRAWTQAREAAVNPRVRPVSAALLWRVTSAGWDLLGFEHLAGRGADFRPGSTDLPLVVDLLTALGRLRCPEVELKDAARRWAAYLDEPADAVAFSGEALLHTDLNHTNVLIARTGHRGIARLVDWAWATRGAAWIDPACWVVWLISAGHHPREAERWAAGVPSWSSASAADLNLFSTAQAGLWRATAEEHPSGWTHQLRDAAARWAHHRHGGGIAAAPRSAGARA
ncbi:aminoglycoside phosphotransferase [Saccharopolyspora sp. CA-218241]|uniref:aminoglycoside phosphotransferase n=1 Tax=Saccharopolyspora sp. CA-218241 TaxID=3240027 RepID=UPI003D990523